MGILQARILEWIILCKSLSFSELTFPNMVHSWYCSLPMQKQFISHIFLPDFQYYSELSWSWEEGPNCSSRGWRDNPVLVNEMWEKSAGKNLGKFFLPDKREICEENPLFSTPPLLPNFEQGCMTVWYREMLQPYRNHGKPERLVEMPNQNPDIRVPSQCWKPPTSSFCSCCYCHNIL